MIVWIDILFASAMVLIIARAVPIGNSFLYGIVTQWPSLIKCSWLPFWRIDTNQYSIVILIANLRDNGIGFLMSKRNHWQGQVYLIVMTISKMTFQCIVNICHQFVKGFPICDDSWLRGKMYYDRIATIFIWQLDWWFCLGHDNYSHIK